MLFILNDVVPSTVTTTTDTDEIKLVDFIPKVYHSIQYRSVVVSYSMRTSGQKLFSAITADHYGIAGSGDSEKAAVKDLMRKMVCSIVYDLETDDAIQLPFQPCSKYTQLRNSFVKSFVNKMKEDPAVTDVHFEVILCPELSTTMYDSSE